MEHQIVQARVLQQSINIEYENTKVEVRTPNAVIIENAVILQPIPHTHTTDEVTTDTDYSMQFENIYLS